MALVDLVEGKVKDESDKLDLLNDYIPAVEAALARYSKHRPLPLVEDLPGTGGSDLALPAAWVEEFSTIKAIEFPLGNIPPTLLDSDAWTLYRAPSGLQLRLLAETPKIAEFVRLNFTGQRAEADVPAGDLDAVASLAASICCTVLASVYAQNSDPTIMADVVNHGSKSGNYTRLSKVLRQRYLDHLGIDEGSTQPAMSTVAAPPATGRVRLTH